MSFEKVLAQWDEDIYTAIQPTLPLPFGGLFQTIAYSRQRGEAKQAELVGMATVAELDIADITSRVGNLATASAVEISASFDVEE